jgi:hypothetical protein
VLRVHRPWTTAAPHKRYMPHITLPRRRPQLAEQCKYVSQKRGAVAFNAKGRDGPARVAPMKKGPLANYTSAFVVA